MKKEYEYISFRQIDVPSRKTQTWVCDSKLGGPYIGVVRWYSPWRKYCYFPQDDTVYHNGCLRDIADFIDQLMAERKASFIQDLKRA